MSSPGSPGELIPSSEKPEPTSLTQPPRLTATPIRWDVDGAYCHTAATSPSEQKVERGF